MVGTIDGSGFECSNVNFNGTLPEASEQVTLHPTFSGCTAFGFVGANVTTTGCNFVFHAGEEVAKSEEGEYRGTADVACESSSKISLNAGGGLCVATIGSQTGINGITYQNSIEAEPTPFNIRFVSSPVAATKNVDGFACPFFGVGATTAYLNGQMLTKGTVGAEKVGVGVGRSTMLCKLNESPCVLANQYAASTLIEGKSTNATVKVNGESNNGAWSMTVGCANAVFKSVTLHRWGNPGLSSVIQNFIFGTCTVGTNACTVGAVNWWNGRIYGGGANGVYRFGASRLRVTCNSWPLVCDFSGPVRAPITSGASGSMSMGPAVLSREAGAPGETTTCDSHTTAEFQGNFNLLQPSPIWVVQ